MEALKYIVTDKGDFAIFSNLSTHSEMARGLYGKPIGAGFCRIKAYSLDTLVTCFGESVTLNLKSAGEEDARIIRKKLIEE